MGEEQIEINYDQLLKLEGYDVIEAKFNIITTLQTKAYDKESYKAEEKIIVKNEKGEDEVKEIPLTNHIRWRNVENEDDDENEDENIIPGFHKINPNKKMESNSKIVEWSDGTFQLVIGDEYYDIMFSKMDNLRYGVEDKENELIVVNKPIRKRMILTPSEYSHHIKKTEKIINQDESNTKVKLAYSFYDKQKYNKDEFSSNKYGKKIKQSPPDKNLNNRKRKRSTNSDF